MWPASRARPSERSSMRVRSRPRARGPPRAGAAGARSAASRKAAPAAPSGPGDDEDVAGPRAAAAGNALRRARAPSRSARAGRPRSCRRRSPARPPRRAPRTAPVRRDTVVSDRAASVTTSPSGSAPDAARSLRLTAAARKPRSRQEIQSSRKWTPSTSASWVTTRPPASSAASFSIRSREPAALELGEQPELAEVGSASCRISVEDIDRPVAGADLGQAVRDRARRRARPPRGPHPRGTGPWRAPPRAWPSACSRRRAWRRRRGARPGSRRASGRRKGGRPAPRRGRR